jgi:hypothetical protein
MHPLTRQTLAEARRRGAVLDLDTHFDAVSRLDAAAQASVIHGADDPDVLDRPIVVGELGNGKRTAFPAVLYPPSYASLEWMAKAAGWYDGDKKMSLLAGAWALSRSNRPDQITAAVRKDIASGMIKQWARCLTCSLAALASAYNSILAPVAKPAQEDGEVSADAPQKGCRIRRLLMRLQAEIGGSEQDWLYGSIHRLRAGIAYLKEKDDAEAQALSKVTGKTEARDPESPAVQAFVRWRKAADIFFKELGVGNE